MDLTYNKLRKVLGVFIKNPTLKQALSGQIEGKGLDGLQIIDVLDLIYDSGADVEILEILTDASADMIDVDTAFEVFSGFFTSIGSSWSKFSGLLTNIASRQNDKPDPATISKNSK